MQTSYPQFREKFPQTEINKILAPLNTFHIGGPADLYYKLTNIEELPALIAAAQSLKINFFILGGGSNTIFADEGFRGLVIQMQAKEIEFEGLPGQTLSFADPHSLLLAAESGALLSQVIQFALKHDLAGMEKLMGLPGTIGGAVRGNAGAFGTETKDFFAKALIYTPGKSDDPAKCIHEVGPDYFKFGYRFSTIKKSHEIILKVWLKLEQNPQLAKKGLEEAMDILKNRISKQPKGYCSGSFFKNPGSMMGKPDDPELKAGHLLEKSGCKGLQIGQIKVSDQHANWLMNLGQGTQKELLELMNMLQTKVKERFNIDLEPEVQLLSEGGPVAVKK